MEIRLSPQHVELIEKLLQKGSVAEVKIEKSQPVVIEIKRKKVEIPPKK